MAWNVPSLVASARVYPRAAHARIVGDVEYLLGEVRSLVPAVGETLHPDGRAATLLYLQGTIPIYYRGSQYNVPVQVWILEQYPAVPPRCLVVPTDDMRIKERHKHVDVMGQVYLPYLHEWNARGSNLIELVSYMSSVFSDEPPCFRHDPRRAAPPPGNAQPYRQQYQAQQQQQQQQPAAVPVAAAGAAAAAAAAAAASPASPGARRNKELVQDLTLNLQVAVRQLNKEAEADLDDLSEKLQRLGEGAGMIDEGMAALRRELDALRAARPQLETCAAETRSWLAAHEGKEALDVDTAVEPSDTWSRQMLEAAAQDHAIEDVVYHLDKALGDDRIELPAYLKHVRRLARDQYFSRALLNKLHLKQLERQMNRPPAQPRPI